MEKPASGGEVSHLESSCECAFPFVPQGKSHSPLVQIKLNLFFQTCLSNFSKVWLPAGPPEASLTWLPPAARCATSKAGCECAFPFVPQGKSHSPLILIGLNLFFKACLVNPLFINQAKV
ncbi:hypothetical protein [Desulfoluna spongiiphila]|uniref:hypothetical protein n=1 Tax=Desulfoluna spongiiphila TaxID=419481 RepID=UPI00125F7D31|nr:hypothetical protein [Desulfoluna spongiiphila]